MAKTTLSWLTWAAGTRSSMRKHNLVSEADGVWIPGRACRDGWPIRLVVYWRYFSKFSDLPSGLYFLPELVKSGYRHIRVRSF